MDVRERNQPSTMVGRSGGGSRLLRHRKKFGGRCLEVMLMAPKLLEKRRSSKSYVRVSVILFFSPIGNRETEREEAIFRFEAQLSCKFGCRPFILLRNAFFPPSCGDAISSDSHVGGVYRLVTRRRRRRKRGGNSIMS